MITYHSQCLLALRKEVYTTVVHITSKVFIQPLFPSDKTFFVSHKKSGLDPELTLADMGVHPPRVIYMLTLYICLFDKGSMLFCLTCS